MYNGWKRKHKTEYQGVVLPNFMIAEWFGLAIGRTNDASRMADAEFIQRMEAMREGLGRDICLYGDVAYPISDALPRAPKGNNVTT